MSPSPYFLAIATVLAPPAIRAGEDAEDAPPTEVAVQTAMVDRTTLHRHLTTYALLAPEPASTDRPAAMARLSPAVSGIVSETTGVEGQHVEKGQILFRLDSRAAEAALAVAKTEVEFATKTAERQRALIAAEGTSKKLLLAAEQSVAKANAKLATAKVNRSLLQGVAPISGTLTKFTARPGEAADAATPLAEIIDLDRLVAAVRVPAADASAVKPGQPAELRIPGAAKPVAAKVVFVGRQVDPATGTVPVRLAVPKGNGLLPGRFVAADIVVLEKTDCLAVPTEAVYTDPDGKSTLSIVEGDTARKIEVKTGLRDGDLIEVSGEGVREGATVVTRGSYALPDETKIVPEP
jgi:membrane fusion protein (multidrug efflux system)